MLAALEPYRHKITRSLQASGVPQFLSWWWHELLSLLPARVQAVVDQPTEAVLVCRQADDLLLWRVAGEDEALTQVALSEDTEMVKARLPAALKDDDGARLPVKFCLDASSVLVSTLNFPAAAEENLRQVLAFEMDRHTPFKAVDVYYDYRILERNPVSQTVSIEVAVVRRKDVDDAVSLCTKRGIGLVGVEVAVGEAGSQHPPDALGVNLLPVESRARRGHVRLKINLALLLLFLLILFAVMWNSLSQKRADLARFSQRVAEVRSEARAVTDLKNELAQAEEASGFLAQRRAQQPALLDVVLVVTHILPDDIWLQRLQVKEDKVSITGHAPDASRVVSILEQTPGLSRPGFVGSITPDQQLGTERFTIEVYADPETLRKLAMQVEPAEVDPTAAETAEPDATVASEMGPSESETPTTAERTQEEVGDGPAVTAGR